jgi:hypothetical protein
MTQRQAKEWVARHAVGEKALFEGARLEEASLQAALAFHLSLLFQARVS